MDDDEDVNDDFDDRNLLRRLRRLGFLRGWLIIYMCGFRIPSLILRRCQYEEFFSVSDPPEPVRKFMNLSPRISEIQPTSSERAARLSRESRPLFKILPLRCRAVSIGDDSVFCDQRFLNSDYSRTCSSKSVPKSGAASILERGARVILARDSQCFWFFFSLLAHLKDEGYHPSNPSLFDKCISALSVTLAAQTSVTANVSEHVTTKWRESDLSHALFTLPDNLKRELLVVPGTSSLLFHQSLLSTAIDNIKEVSLLFSTSSVAALSIAAVKLSHRVVPVGATHLCMLHVWTPQASARVPLSLLSGCEVGSWRVFASTPSGQSLGSGGGVSAPEGSHRAGSSPFARLLQLFVYRHEGLGVVAASNGSLAFEPHCTQDMSS